jgi:broad specificity phosphatase PhoE
VREKFPHEYKARDQDKLRYRYPRGESYLDVISRSVNEPGKIDTSSRLMGDLGVVDAGSSP